MRSVNGASGDQHLKSALLSRIARSKSSCHIM